MTPTLRHRLTVTGYALLGLLSAGALLAGYGGMVSPQFSTIPAILALTFPGWLILELLALVLCLIFCRRMALVPALTLLLLAGPILTFFPLNFHTHRLTPQEQKSSFSLVSYNVFTYYDFNAHYGPDNPLPSFDELKRQMAEGRLNTSALYLIDTRPDIACLQEAPQPVEYAPYFMNADMAEEMKSIFPFRGGMNGQDIYTRYPAREIKLRQPESIYSWFGGALVDIDGHETLVISVHMQSIGLNDDDKQLIDRLAEGEAAGKVKAVRHQLLGKLSAAFRKRAIQARLLRQQIDSIGVRNVIVAGDFNDIPGCYACRIIAGDDFRSAFAEAGIGPTFTYHGNRLYFNIDHIFYRGDMQPYEFERIKTGWSDHYPICAKFYWKDPTIQ